MREVAHIILRGVYFNYYHKGEADLLMENGKIKIVESHNEVLRYWGEYRREKGIAPLVLTMDYHTDLHEPFAKLLALKENSDENKEEDLIKKINFNDAQTIEWAIEQIRYDEHIKTAIKTNIISAAFVIAYESGWHNEPMSNEELKEAQSIERKYMDVIEGKDPSGTKRPHTYPEVEERIYVPSWYYLDGISEEGKDCFKDSVIDDDFLDDILKSFKEMSRGDFNDEGEISSKYILDIDLDYFTTEKSLSPKKTKTFYNIIRNAELITIAREPKFVKDCSNNMLNSDCVLKKICEHIQSALL